MGKRDRTKHYPTFVPAKEGDVVTARLLRYIPGEMFGRVKFDRNVPRGTFYATPPTTSPHVLTAEQINAEYERMQRNR